MTAKNNSVSPADVAAKVEEKKVTTVPAQANPESVDATETDELCAEGGKKSLKDRLSDLGVKVKKNKRAVVTAGVLVTTAVVAFVKYAKTHAGDELEVVEADSETVESADES